MKKKILMSIMTKYSNKIFNGTKKWEFRKNLPKIDSSDELTIVVYSSKDDKAIVGEFTAGRILKCSFNELMDITGNKDDPVAMEWFRNYYSGRKTCCAIEVVQPIRYRRRISLRTITMKDPSFRAPQNFMYIHENDYIDQLIKDEKYKK